MTQTHHSYIRLQTIKFVGGNSNHTVVESARLFIIHRHHRHVSIRIRQEIPLSNGGTHLPRDLAQMAATYEFCSIDTAIQ